MLTSDLDHFLSHRNEYEYCQDASPYPEDRTNVLIEYLKKNLMNYPLRLSPATV